jgi:hypothetical protein
VRGRSLRRRAPVSGLGMAERMAAEPQVTPESRVRAAGYAPCFGLGWISPDGLRVVSLEQAVREVQGQWQQEDGR